MVYERISDYISEHGIKQSSIAKKIGISPQSFSAAMHGDRKITAEEFIAICEALGISLDRFQK